MLTFIATHAGEFRSTALTCAYAIFYDRFIKLQVTEPRDSCRRSVHLQSYEIRLQMKARLDTRD